MKDKPVCKLIGQEGCVFSVITRVGEVLEKAGQIDERKEFRDKAFRVKSFDEVFALAGEYVEVE